ncbi:MAG: hypothetical protein HOD01_06865, partial [Oceanospirillaceae bacterium]|nr:hypothetical protein [Oceanospirillaceae bacterium]
MQGFVLSRHSRDGAQGIDLIYWLVTDGGPVCLRQTQQECVCFLPISQQTHAQKLMRSMDLSQSVWHFEAIALKTFQQEQAVALYMTNHKLFQQTCSALREAGIGLMEQDIQPQERYLMERFISAGLVADTQATNGELNDVRVKSSDFVPNIKAIALDIETTIDGKTIHSIAVYGKQDNTPVERVWLHWPKGMDNDLVVSVADTTCICTNERQMLKQFSHWLQEYDPD